MEDSTLDAKMKSQKENWQRHRIATKRAQERMKQEGWHYPIFTSNMSPDENYAELRAYGERESLYIKEELTKIDTHLKVPFPVATKEDWMKAYD